MTLEALRDIVLIIYCILFIILFIGIIVVGILLYLRIRKILNTVQMTLNRVQAAVATIADMRPLTGVLAWVFRAVESINRRIKRKKKEKEEED